MSEWVSEWVSVYVVKQAVRDRSFGYMMCSLQLSYISESSLNGWLWPCIVRVQSGNCSYLLHFCSIEQVSPCKGQWNVHEKSLEQLPVCVHFIHQMKNQAEHTVLQFNVKYSQGTVKAVKYTNPVPVVWKNKIRHKETLFGYSPFQSTLVTQ